MKLSKKELSLLSTVLEKRIQKLENESRASGYSQHTLKNKAFELSLILTKIHDEKESVDAFESFVEEF